MATDKSHGKPANRARHAPLQNTRYTDAELNARVRGFPQSEEFWRIDRAHSVFVNPQQPIDTVRSREGQEITTVGIDLNFLKINEEILVPAVVMLRAHLLLRRYRFGVIEKQFNFSVFQSNHKEGLYGWHISSYDKRRSVALLEHLYGTGAVAFRKRACQIYRERFSEELSRVVKTRRGVRSIPLSYELREQLYLESSVIKLLRRALADAEIAAAEWTSILSGKNVPSLNKLHRIAKPSQGNVEEMNDHEMFITSVVISFFGGTNAALIYPEMALLEEALQVVCFLGRVNLGQIWPTLVEAKAFLKYCDAGCDQTSPDDVRTILTAVDNYCGWKKQRGMLLQACRQTIVGYNHGRLSLCCFGRLWPMV